MATAMAIPETQSRTLVIRKYQAGDAAAFRALNEIWIEKYFALEEEDRLKLGDPEGQIIAKGGQVIMAIEDGRPIGCCALLAEGHNVFELGKMAVDEQLRGRGIGRKLLEFAIAEARQMGAKTIILGSNTKLANAVHLYESVGFQHVPPEELPPSPYSRANVHMRLSLVREG